ncbi:hypothetical protein D1007_53516 [Hordeum vulgare]|nr:hypothetical protein D1007_53516 [Hordeum vulgare]
MTRGSISSLTIASPFPQQTNQSFVFFSPCSLTIASPSPHPFFFFFFFFFGYKVQKRQPMRDVELYLSLHLSWPRYGEVSLTRCPDCPRISPLVRHVTRKKENGNKGREFVTCESMPEVEKDLPPCNHFEWMDEYIERLQMDGLIDSTGAAKMVLDLRSTWKTMWDAEILCYDSVAPMMGDAELKGELKKLNKHLRQMIDLTKRADLIVATFYLCIVGLGFAYLLIISR